ncbi:MAG: FHA domain-containing protein [Deltaproteobacteria bacterium]|nr:FHA domain-containing protein [Deltaproteobacteria bacterium]
MLAVVFKDETGEKKVHGLETTKVFTVGRGNAAAPDQEPTHIRIRHASVSRAHAEFYEADDGNWCVRDVGSSNHTFLNGEQIDIAYVQEGDVIRFGDFTVKVETVPDPVRAASPGRRSRVIEEPPPPEPEPVASGRRARPSAGGGDATSVPADDSPAARRAAQAASMRGAAATPARKPPPPPEPEPEPEYEPEPEPEPPPRRGRAPVAEPEPPRRAAAPEPAPSGRRPRNMPEPEPAPAPSRRGAAPPPEPEPPPRRAEPAPADDSSMRRSAPEVRKGGGGGGVVGVDPAEFRAVQDKANKLEDQLREEKKKYEEALRRIQDLEARDTRHEDEMRDWQDRYDKAREQTDHMQDLLERARDDNREHEETIEAFEKEVAELESQLKQFEATKGETQDVLADLKSKAVQKDRRIDELQRELDMMEFDLRNAREELESVQNSMNFENTETRKLERELTLLREVIHEKENHAKSLQIEIEERDKEIYDLKLGTGVKDLQQAKTEMMEKYFAKDKEAAELREKVAKLELELGRIKGELADAQDSAKEVKDLSNHPDFKRKDRELQRAIADADAAREELERLQDKLAAFGPEHKAKLESERDTLRKKVTQLEEKVDELEAGQVSQGASDAELTSAKRKIGQLEEKIEELEDELAAAKKDAKAAASAGGEGDAALKKQLTSLEDKVDQLTSDLRKAKQETEKWKTEAEKAKSAPAPAKPVSFDKDAALDNLDAIQDLYRSWMSNLDVLKTYGEDIEGAKGDAKKIRDACDGIGQTLTSIEKDASDMRGELKALRNAIEKG